MLLAAPAHKGGAAMFFSYKTVDDKLVYTDTIEKNCWVNMINPTEAELRQVAEATGLEYDFLKDPLDDEEIPRVEVEEDQVLIIINIPIICKEDVIYDTIPLGIILNDDYLVTACLEDANLLGEFSSTRNKSIATFKKTRFIFQLFHKKTNLFLKYLRDIHRRNTELEASLRGSMKNTELMQLMSLQKSLVYFSTGLRANAKVLERLLRGKTIKMYEEDEDLLEDVIIENRQAVEMSDVYSNISAGTMTAFASLISNNLSNVMRLLTAITIILAIPTMIASFWGMNVSVPLGNSIWGFPLILSGATIACSICAWLLKKKGML